MRLIKDIQVVNKYSDLSALGYKRLWNLNQLVHKANLLEGDIVECGVYKGGSAGLIAQTLLNDNSDKTLWLFDSFNGLPKPGKVDVNFKGEQSTYKNKWNKAHMSEVEKNLPRYMNIRIVKGWFKDTLPSEIRKISLLHLDCDWYKSAKVCLERLYPLVVKGGFIVLDDWGHWKGFQKAVTDYFGEELADLEFHHVDYTGVWFQKI